MTENNQIELLQKRIEELEKKLAEQKEISNEKEHIENIQSNLKKTNPSKSNKKYDYDDKEDDDDLDEDLKSTPSQEESEFPSLFFIGIALILWGCFDIFKDWGVDICRNLTRTLNYGSCKSFTLPLDLFAIPLGLILSIKGIFKKK